MLFRFHVDARLRPQSPTSAPGRGPAGQGVAEIRAGNGLQADLHELNLTPQGTALVTAYRVTTTDLSVLGGPSNGQVLAPQAQEIDIATGKLLWYWDCLEHVPVTETCSSPPNEKQTSPFDYFHMNSIAVAPDGDLLISARNTWAVFKLCDGRRAMGDARRRGMPQAPRVGRVPNVICCCQA
jgi:hypothetical protein